MLKIPQINIFNFNGRRSLVNDKLMTPDFGVSKFSSLMPLEKDTISFSGRKNSSKKVQKEENSFDFNGEVNFISVEDKALNDKERTISNKVAHIIHQEAQQDNLSLARYLDKQLGSLIVDQNSAECDKDHPILKLEFRTKGPNSIREKASAKSLYSKDAVKGTLTDIIGGRIVIGDSTKGAADMVLANLAQSVENGDLKIIEVENHTPINRNFQYAKAETLNKFAKTCGAKYGKDFAIKSSQNQSGYTAIHLLVQFDDGYVGEIQILGCDVLQLKELEDISYKVLRNKSISPKYEPLRALFEPMLRIDEESGTSDKKAKKMREDFMRYADASYKHERMKGNSPRNKKTIIPVFLTLDEFRASSKKKVNLPDEVDFNNIYKMKSIIDGHEE